MSFIPGFLRVTELICWVTGAVLFVFFMSKVAVGESERAADIAAFEAAFPDRAPDMSLWSESRIKAYEKSKAEPPERVVAVLYMPDIGMKVPVYRNISELNLDRGAGLIEGMAALDAVGNVGIAGHRDGYFRVLKDVKIGHRLILRTSKELLDYRVSQILIVDQDRVDVLAPADERTVTLVTCYPFYYIGTAPRRFIVKAQLEKNKIKKEK